MSSSKSSSNQKGNTEMKCNVGKADRIVRITVGLCIVGAGVYFQSWLGAIGVIPLVTAALGWCPLYVPLGISSCKQ
jgi:hypothetical protein